MTTRQARYSRERVSSKRHSKWTQGNMEFIKRYTGTILRSPMRWFEKLDIVLFTYSLPLTAVFSLFVAMHVIVLPLMGYTLVYPLWMLVPTLMSSWPRF
jgi:hypothetical protein